MITNFNDFNINESISTEFPAELIKHFSSDNKYITISDSDEFKENVNEYKIFIFNKYLIICNIDNINRPTCMIIQNSPKSRFGYKIVQNFYYKSIESMEKGIIYFIDNINKSINYKKEYKEKRKLDNEKATELLSIGDIMYDSWGYEQTNIDFYQVTNIKGKTAYLRPIASETVKGSEGNMSANVKPVPNKFTGDEFKKIIKAYGNKVYLTSKHGSISKYTSGDSGVYSSWYY